MDLRGGVTLWEARNGTSASARPLTQNTRADIVIIGAGITGSFIAEALSRDGRSIIVLDRYRPQMASTAASTALLQWEIDTPLRELAHIVGFERAADVYQASIQAVRDILSLVDKLGIACDCRPRSSLYLAGDEMGPAELQDEWRLRSRAHIDSFYLDHAALWTNFALDRPAALFDRGCAEADPLALARGLMGHAMSRGVAVHSPVEIVDYEITRHGAAVLTADGLEVGCDMLILANGYDMPPIVPARLHSIVSTWAVATEPLSDNAWGDALLWEASDPYLYARRTADHRLIIGGEDEDITDPDQRDAKIQEKTKTLLAKMHALKRGMVLTVDYAWSGFFGTTDDGLPLIGNLPGHDKVFAAFGYGGNGITFSAIAAQLIAQALAGRYSPLLESFRIDR
ncbi:MAG: NAD(P)/FAD-dependent oxidoreductase [Parvibaculaceae bacterium]